MSKLAVIANTEKITKKESRHLRDALAGAGCDDVEWFEVQHGSDAKKAARKALKRGAETVLVCGGDGSVRSASEALVDQPAGLAVVPSGTANLFASGLLLPTDLDEIAATIAHGPRRRVDTATCNGQTFNVLAGAGFDVRMLADAEASKERLGTLAYVRSSVQQARRRKLFKVSVEVDGTPFFDGRASCVLVGNTGRLKAGMAAFPGATNTDGLLHVAVVTAAGIRDWTRLAASSVFRRQAWSPQAQMTEGRTILVTFDRKRRFELDGGVKTRAKKLEFAINPRSLLICAPPSRPAAD